MASNYEWLVDQMKAASNESELRRVVVDIGSDKFENEPWTKDQAKLRELRRLHKEQIAKIRGQDDGKDQTAR